MHYLQNSWFVTNWLWVIALMVLSVSVVAYINNKTLLLKKSLVTLSLIFVLALSTTLAFTASTFSPTPIDLNNTNTTETSTVESGSVFNKLATYILAILSDKVSE